MRIPVVGDCRNSLLAIREHLEAREPLPWKERFAAWQGQLDEWKQEQPITWTPGETTIKPQEVIKAVDRITEGKAILTTEVGQHQMWAAQLYNFTEPRTLLTSGGLGTMATASLPPSARSSPIPISSSSTCPATARSR